MEKSIEGKGEDIEITPEMLEAGANCLLEHPIIDPSAEEMKIVARDVFRAMVGARPKMVIRG